MNPTGQDGPRSDYVLVGAKREFVEVMAYSHEDDTCATVVLDATAVDQLATALDEARAVISTDSGLGEFEV